MMKKCPDLHTGVFKVWKSCGQILNLT